MPWGSFLFVRRGILVITVIGFEDCFRVLWLLFRGEEMA